MSPVKEKHHSASSSSSSSTTSTMTVEIELEKLIPYLENHGVLSKPTSWSVVLRQWKDALVRTKQTKGLDDGQQQQTSAETEENESVRNDMGDKKKEALDTSSWRHKVDVIQKRIREILSEQTGGETINISDTIRDDLELKNEDDKEEERRQKHHHAELIKRFIHETIGTKYGDAILSSTAASSREDPNLLNTLTYFDVRNLVSFLTKNEHDDYASSSSLHDNGKTDTTTAAAAAFLGSFYDNHLHNESPYITPWANEVLQPYKHDNTHIVSSTRLLSRAVKYEMPSLKEQISLHSKKITHITTGLNDLQGRSYGDACIRFDSMCSELGINGVDDFERSVGLLPRTELPRCYRVIEREFRSNQGGKDAMLYYRDFMKFVNFVALMVNVEKKKHKKKEEEEEEEEKDGEEDLILLPRLTRIVQGDSICKDGTIVDTEKSKQTIPALIAEEIESRKEEQSFGEDNNNDGGKTNRCDLDEDATKEEHGEGVNWNIETTETGEDGAFKTGKNNAENLSTDNRNSMLASKDFRQDLITDLKELKAFLKSRLIEIQGGSSDKKKKKRIDVSTETKFVFVHASAAAAVGGGGGGGESDASCMPIKTSADLESYLAAVQTLLDKLTTGRFKTLTLLEESATYRSRIVSNLNNALDSVMKIQEKIDFAKVRKKELQHSVESLKKDLELYERRVEEVKKELEEELGLLLGGKTKRHVRIIV